jgi:hypothetical protein
MKLLGIADLAKRWDYTKQGIHQKMKRDLEFPKPIAKINEQRIMVFDEKDIIEYELKKRELTDQNYKKWFTHRGCNWN